MFRECAHVPVLTGHDHRRILDDHSAFVVIRQIIAGEHLPEPFRTSLIGMRHANAFAIDETASQIRSTASDKKPARL